jgi:hypothetical protein
MDIGRNVMKLRRRVAWTGRPPRQLDCVLVLLVATAALAAPALGARSPDQLCQRGRYHAAAKYALCHQDVLGQFFAGAFPDDARFLGALSKCRVKYAESWTKLQTKTKGTGVPCDDARFEDDGVGTVTDRLTGLQWEKKTDDATVHDKDHRYARSAASPFTTADGPVFTAFLAALNAGCFAGHCDWRLPTAAELESILLAPYPCTTNPCIDPIFGPTVGFGYWSDTLHPSYPGGAWLVDFENAYMIIDNNGFGWYVRAVRGGL